MIIHGVRNCTVFYCKIGGNTMNRRIANAMYITALTQNDETLELIERRFGKGENYIKTCREMHISPTTYYRLLAMYKDDLIYEYHAQNYANR